jgi:hypothetical protein
MTEERTPGSTEFADRMLRMMNEAAVALMVSVGHRTGLFDVMAEMPAATSGRIVEHDGAAGSYSLPATRAAWLTRATGMANLATGMQYIGLLTLVEDQIVDCSGTAAGSRTRRSRGSRRSWPKTAAPSRTPT